MSGPPPAGFSIDLRRSVTPWPRGTRWRRLFWTICISPMVRFSPRPLRGFRIALLRWMGAKIGRECNILPGCKILMPWNLELGDYSAIGRDVEIYNFAPIKIGPMTVISQYVFLCTGTHDFTHPHMPLIFYPITVGKECWVAAGAFVAPNVTIGDGTVVGAYSVVSKSLPEWKICAGNPCRVLKDRTVDTTAGEFDYTPFIG